MNTSPIQRWLRRLSVLSPYFVIEPLVPGATLVALLLWLSHQFVHDRLDGVRQHLFQPRGIKAVIAAASPTLRKRLCPALRQRVVRACEHMSLGFQGAAPQGSA